MEQTSARYTIQQFIDKYENETLNFEFALQRDAGQWNIEQASMLIRSIVQKMIIPSIYLVKEETAKGEVWTVIDGKQRLTTMINFFNNKFRLSSNLPPVTIANTEYNISKKHYKDLPECIKERFSMRALDSVFMFDFNKEEIEEQFYCLNNGSVFTKQQKAVVKLGTKLAEKITPFEQHPFWDRANISNIQKRHGVVMETVLKSFMLLTDYDYQQFGAAEVVKFSSYYSDNYKPQEITYFGDLLDKLNRYIPNDDRINEILKPINIPIFIMNLDHFESTDRNSEEYEAFITWWCKEGIYSDDYQRFCGSGSTNRNKVWGRMEIMDKALDDFLGRNASEELNIKKQTA